MGAEEGRISSLIGVVWVREMCCTGSAVFSGAVAQAGRDRRRARARRRGRVLMGGEYRRWIMCMARGRYNTTEYRRRCDSRKRSWIFTGLESYVGACKRLLFLIFRGYRAPERSLNPRLMAVIPP